MGGQIDPVGIVQDDEILSYKEMVDAQSNIFTRVFE